MLAQLGFNKSFFNIFYVAQLQLQIKQNRLLFEYPEDNELPEEIVKSHFDASVDVTIDGARYTERDPLIESQIHNGSEYHNARRYGSTMGEGKR